MVLFNTGPDGNLCLDSAAKQGAALADIELAFLSHWHFDHSGGLPVMAGAIAEARSAAGGRHRFPTCSRPGPASGASD